MNTNKLLRHINAIRSLRLLAQGQALSRADIARELGLTRATIGYAIAELSDAGLVIENAEATSDGRKGRPGTGIQLNPHGAYFLGVDIGTKVLTTVLIDLNMSVVIRRVDNAGSDFRNPDQITTRILSAIQTVLQESGIAPDLVEGVGISVPGLVGHDGSVVNAPFLEWRHYPLRQILAKACPEGWSVMVCNDAFAFAGAERAILPPTESKNLFLLLLAEGIGGASLDGERVFTGAHGYAGEIGHAQITVNGRTEAFDILAGAKLFADFFVPDQTVAEGVDLLLVRQSEPAVSQVLDQWADAVATGLANILHLFDPGRVILGGPIAALYPCRKIRVDHLLEGLLLYGFSLPDISVASFGADGAAIGAAATIREQMFALPELEGQSILRFT